MTEFTAGGKRFSVFEMPENIRPIKYINTFEFDFFPIGFAKTLRNEVAIRTTNIPAEQIISEIPGEITERTYIILLLSYDE